MSISGMTGFARVEGGGEGVRFLWEAKSVNGRALDLKLRLPPGFDALEPAARALAAQRFKRGSLQASLTLTREAAAAAPRIDLEFVRQLLEAGAPFVKTEQIKKPSWDGLLAVRGVLISDESGPSEAARASLEAVLLGGLETAFGRLAEARAEEGRMLARVMGEQCDRLDALVAAARQSASAAPAAAIDRIRTRLATLAPEVQLDPQRLAQEAALAAMRADVAEELERLAAHADALRKLLASPELAGRKLDFLGQELTREANTLTSKSADLELTRIGLELKAVVDQIKEQAANVE